MAKFNIIVNTDPNNKSLSVTMNGQKIDRVSDFNAYQDLDKDGNVTGVSVHVDTREKLEDNTVKRISYYSYGSVEAEKINQSDITVDDSIEGFIGVSSTFNLFDDIAKYLKAKSN